jgi:phosphatidylserine/phosphatidylglycerophosphate/cardiolipin synthase-like enzyme
MTGNETIIGREFPEKVIPLIEAAKKSIEIIVFDWRWYPQDPGASVQLFNQAIIRAARRDVKIRVIANCEDIIKILTGQNIEAKKLVSKKLVHCKLMIIDGQDIVIGSHNYTQSAFQMNYELSLILFGPENVAEFSSFFNNLFASNV